MSISKIFFLSFFVLCLSKQDVFSQDVLRYELGIHRPNLSWAGTLAEEKYLIDKMNEMGAKSVRLNPSGSVGVNDFIEHVKYANQLGIKVNMVISLTAFPEFYPPGTTKRPQIGNWDPRYRLSDMDPEKIEVWAGAVFDQMSAVGAQIELVEFGNESNWIDFNGDLPYISGGKFYDYSTDWTDPDYIKIREGFSKYGIAFKKVREELNRVWGTNTVKLITNGAVEGYHLSSWTQSHGGTILSTAVMLDLLKGTHPNLPSNSTNYLNEADGIGIHFYPQVIELDLNIAKETVANEIRAIMDPLINVVGEDFPFWVTEWDYPKAKFTNSSETDRYKMFQNFLAVCQGLPYNWKKFYLFTFDQGSHRVYENGQFLPGAQIFSDYTYNQNAWDLNGNSYRIQNAYSDMYLRGYDQNGSNHDGNDSYISIMNDQSLPSLKWYVEKVPNESGMYRLKNESSSRYMRGYDPVTATASSKITQHALESWSTLKWRIMPSLYEGEFHVQGVYGGHYIQTNSTVNYSYPTLVPYQNTWTSIRWRFLENTTLNNPNTNRSLTDSGNLKKDGISLFPNPVNQVLYLHLPKDDTKVSIYNSIGALIFENSYKNHDNNNISFAHMTSGLYIVKIFDGQNSIVKKIIKE